MEIPFKVQKMPVKFSKKSDSNRYPPFVSSDRFYIIFIELLKIHMQMGASGRVAVICINLQQRDSLQLVTDKKEQLNIGAAIYQHAIIPF